ncbi:MAG TPA: hypothetical protein DCO77_14180 [Nitrospiraceae bacterium]|nr:hypothetical protein [Nitrospiraceae bacterium]
MINLRVIILRSFSPRHGWDEKLPANEPEKKRATHLGRTECVPASVRKHAYPLYLFDLSVKCINFYFITEEMFLQNVFWRHG